MATNVVTLSTMAIPPSPSRRRWCSYSNNSPHSPKAPPSGRRIAERASRLASGPLKRQGPYEPANRGARAFDEQAQLGAFPQLTGSVRRW